MAMEGPTTERWFQVKQDHSPVQVLPLLWTTNPFAT